MNLYKTIVTFNLSNRVPCRPGVAIGRTGKIPGGPLFPAHKLGRLTYALSSSTQARVLGRCHGDKPKLLMLWC